MIYLVVFEVSGNGEFPLDMLRYEHVAPAHGDDATAIYSSFYAHRRTGDEYQRPTIRLTRMTNNRLWRPTEGRWKSFGWDVVGNSFIIQKV